MKRILLVIVVILLSAPAYSLTGISFGVKGGVAMNADLGPAETLADIDKMKLIGGQIKIATLPVIDFIGTVEYAWAKEQYLNTGANLKFHDLALTVSAVYQFKMQTIKPYAGIGIGNHALGLTVEGGGVSATIPEGSYLGYHLVGGFDIGIPAFPFGLTGEARINFITSDGEKTKYFQMTAGLNYSFL